MTSGQVFSQHFTQLFGSTPPVFERFKSLNADDVIQWLVLLDHLNTPHSLQPLMAINNRETVGSVANKLRNYESMISGLMQAQVSAVVKELREEMREMREEMRRNSSHVALVRVTGPRVRAQHPPARERGYTPRAGLWFFLCDHGEDMGKWDGKPTSALAARVRELKERNTNRGGPTKKVVLASHDQAARYYRSEDDISDPCEGTSAMCGQEGNNDQC
ncbi:hypothetical protein DUI87_23801 [Hirundo rustica rustica]|uniref:Uncharacterized protein n=1 Tax=Hirundo rustica rustica TaxID=333673 RepID=A0A3M0JFD3_HIRRU|nr:hypothetical protein DUI87_23801 [Hirundo rustica rustica]